MQIDEIKIGNSTFVDERTYNDRKVIVVCDDPVERELHFQNYEAQTALALHIHKVSASNALTAAFVKQKEEKERQAQRDAWIEQDPELQAKLKAIADAKVVSEIPQVSND